MVLRYSQWKWNFLVMKYEVNPYFLFKFQATDFLNDFCRNQRQNVLPSQRVWKSCSVSAAMKFMFKTELKSSAAKYLPRQIIATSSTVPINWWILCKNMKARKLFIYLFIYLFMQGNGLVNTFFLVLAHFGFYLLSLIRFSEGAPTPTQPALTCSMLTIETLEQGLKYVRS